VPIRKLDPVGAIGNYWGHERQPTPQEVSLLQALADSSSGSGGRNPRRLPKGSPTKARRRTATASFLRSG